jgi:hypothetical protein
VFYITALSFFVEIPTPYHQESPIRRREPRIIHGLGCLALELLPEGPDPGEDIRKLCSVVVVGGALYTSTGQPGIPCSAPLNHFYHTCNYRLYGDGVV